MQRLSIIINSESHIANQTNAKALTSVDSVSFQNVGFGYSESTKSVLENINLTIPQNTSLGIVGNVGSGKSSLIKLLPRLYDVTTGSILINGDDIRKFNLQQLRSKLGVVLQEPFLFSMSIRNNITIGKSNASTSEIHEAAVAACLYDEVQTFPHGFETVIGERGISLSGGQKQRLAIARALLRKPDILILDDALSAVDTSTESKILTNLKSLLTQTTSIIIAHRISTVQHCNNIIVLDSGSVVEQGTHNELLAKNGLYTEMYNYQLLEEEILQ